jgi:CRP-like cAMP-binding protein
MWGPELSGCDAGGVEWTLLSGLGEETRREVLTGAVRRRYGRGRILFLEGDPGDGMFLIESGWVAVRINTPRGDVATLAVVGPEEPLGEQALIIDGGTRSADAVALTPIAALYLSRPTFDELRRRHPAIDRVLATMFEDRLRRVSARLVEALYVSSPKRVLRRVLEVAEAFGDGLIPLSQQDVATLAGTTRPTVNRVLRNAEQRGGLRLSRGGITMVDPAVVAAMAR